MNGTCCGRAGRRPGRPAGRERCKANINPLRSCCPAPDPDPSRPPTATTTALPTWVVRPKKRSGSSDSISMGLSADRRSTSRAAAISSSAGGRSRAGDLQLLNRHLDELPCQAGRAAAWQEPGAAPLLTPGARLARLRTQALPAAVQPTSGARGHIHAQHGGHVGRQGAPSHLAHRHHLHVVWGRA